MSVTSDIYDWRSSSFEYPPLPGKKIASAAIIVDSTRQPPQPSPYLQLGARLSQVWLNHGTLFTLLILARLLFATRGLHRDLSNGQANVDVACRELQSAASNAVSMPHYLAQGTNALIRQSVDGSVSALRILVVDLLTAVEAIVLFFINTFKSTYLCLLELAISGSLDAVVDAAETITTYVNTTLVEISGQITSGIVDANKLINDSAGVIEKVAKFLGEKVDIPTIDIPQVAQLKTLQIPSSFDVDLQAIKDNLNLDAVQNTTDAIIKLPFEQLKALLNGTLANYTFSDQLLSVPPLEQLTFCTNGSLAKTFVDVEDTVLLVYHVCLAILLFVAVLFMVPSAFKAWWEWKALSSEASRAAKILRSVQPADSVDLVQIAVHPLQNALGFELATKFKSQKNKNLARWYVSYVTHSPAFLALLLATAGLTACAFQEIMVSSLLRATPSISSDIGDVSVLVYDKMLNSSTIWANHTNSVLLATQEKMNHDLLGWVGSSTTAVNQTINVFTDELIKALNSTFGGTVLYTPILKVLDCLILLKVRGIEDGLTWVHDKAHLTLPTVPTDTLAMGEGSPKSLFTNVGPSTGRQVKDVVGKIAAAWKVSIRQEATCAAVLGLAWLMIALAGLCRCIVDARRESSQTAFSSCFAKDLKACISLPRRTHAHSSMSEETLESSRMEEGKRTKSPSLISRLGNVPGGVVYALERSEAADGHVSRYGILQS